MRTYRLSAAGRRTNLALLIGALVIWFFALWSLSSTLGIQYAPAQFWASVQAVFSAGLGVGRVVPALLMLALIIATPLLIWNLLVEWTASYTPMPDGLQFTALGVQITYPWATIQSLQSGADDQDEPLDAVIVAVDQTEQIAHPLTRALFRQAFGRTRLPIFAGVADRADLVAAIGAAVGRPDPRNAGQPSTAG
jgi:hypothetical protein